MGQPIRLRARRAEHKDERRNAILAAGRALLERESVADVKMLDVAVAANLAKGTIFLYFPTKEALCLEVLLELLGEWFDVLDTELEKPGRFTAQRFVRVVVASVASRSLLVRLTAILSTVLERNVEVERIVEFKTRLLARLTRTGALVERRLGLPEGDGARLLLRVNAVVVGLYQACDLGPAAREALDRPALHPLRLDFAAELPVLLTALLEGILPRD